MQDNHKVTQNETQNDHNKVQSHQKDTLNEQKDTKQAYRHMKWPQIGTK